MKFIRKAIFNWRLVWAIKKAKRLKKRNKYKYLVLTVMGKPRVYSKFQLKHLIRIRFFKKGTTIQQLEALALYKTI